MIPPVPPIKDSAYGLKCPECKRAAMYLTPAFLQEYGRGNLHVSEKNIYHDPEAPWKHVVKDGEKIMCQWCGAAPLQIHASALGQFWMSSIKRVCLGDWLSTVGHSVEETAFRMN